MNQWLSSVDRASIIRWTAIYLLVYAVVNICGAVVFGFAGLMSTGIGAMTAGMGGDLGSADANAAAATLAGMGGLSIGLGILYLISVPVFAIAAWGLFQRKTWARLGAVIALAVSLVLSLLTLSTGITNIIWILISGFAIYLFWTDAGIRRELSR